MESAAYVFFLEGIRIRSQTSKWILAPTKYVVDPNPDPYSSLMLAPVMIYICCQTLTWILAPTFAQDQNSIRLLTQIIYLLVCVGEPEVPAVVGAGGAGQDVLVDVVAAVALDILVQVGLTPQG